MCGSKFQYPTHENRCRNFTTKKTMNSLNLNHLFNSFNSNSHLKKGFLIGFLSSFIFSTFFSLISSWNCNLSFILNIVNFFDSKSHLFLSKLCRYKESDLKLISQSRKDQLLLPLGPSKEMKSIITEKIQSKNDNYEIPIQIFIPLNHSLNSPIIIYYHGGLKRDSQSFSLYFHLFLSFSQSFYLYF